MDRIRLQQFYLEAGPTSAGDIAGDYRSLRTQSSAKFPQNIGPNPAPACTVLTPAERKPYEKPEDEVRAASGWGRPGTTRGAARVCSSGGWTSATRNVGLRRRREGGGEVSPVDYQPSG